MPPKIPAHVFGYSLAVIPCIVYGMYYKRNYKSDEDFEKMLMENYKHNIQSSRAKRENMAQFLQGIKDPGSNPDTERRLAEALHGGKSEVKRHYAVDEKLYGTEEGEKQRQLAIAEQKRKEEERKKRRKGEKRWEDELAMASQGKGGASVEESKGTASEISKETNDEGGKEVSKSRDQSLDTNYVVTIAAVGTVAAVAGFLLGGKRSQ